MHFFVVRARVCVSKEQKASAAGLEPATPRSEVWCASDCAMRPSSSVRWSVWIEEKKESVSGSVIEYKKEKKMGVMSFELMTLRL